MDDVARKVPSAVLDVSNVVAVSAGNTHTCFLSGSGLVRCAGNNAGGLPARGTGRAHVLLGCRSPAFAPGHPATRKPGRRSSCHACSPHPVTPTTAYQLGDGTTTARPRPVTPAAVASLPVASVAAGNQFTCFALQSGGVKCIGGGPCSGSGAVGAARGRLAAGGWRRAAPGPHISLPHHYLPVNPARSAVNSNGQLGSGVTSTPATRDAVDVAGITDAVAVAAGDGHACALRRGGKVSCWGRSTSGQGERRGSRRVEVTWCSPAVPFSRPPDLTCHPPPCLPPRPVVAGTTASAVAPTEVIAGNAVAVVCGTSHTVRPAGARWWQRSAQPGRGGGGGGAPPAAKPPASTHRCPLHLPRPRAPAVRPPQHQGRPLLGQQLAWAARQRRVRNVHVAAAHDPLQPAARRGRARRRRRRHLHYQQRWRAPLRGRCAACGAGWPAGWAGGGTRGWRARAPAGRDALRAPPPGPRLTLAAAAPLPLLYQMGLMDSLAVRRRTRR
jgi:hypothetical protein